MRQALLPGLAIFLAGAPAAHATLIQGTSLQDQLDARTYDGSFQDVNTAQAPADELWTLASSGNGSIMLLFELAGFANDNILGIYDPYDLSNTMQIFSGPDGAGTKAGLIESSTTPGLYGTCLFTDFGCTPTGETIWLGLDGLFGFYLDSPVNGGTRFYSQSALNSHPAADGTTDQMVAFAGDGSDSIDAVGNGNYGIFAPGEYIIAWEDLPLSSSDRDYNDMVVLMESVIPVPEPGTLALLGAGLLAFGYRRVARTSASRRPAAVRC